MRSGECAARKPGVHLSQRCELGPRRGKNQKPQGTLWGGISEKKKKKKTVDKQYGQV